METYEQACARCATEQGLDEITAVLELAAIPYEVDQTGGFTMCVRVQRADGWYVYVTDGDVTYGEPGWHLGAYAADYETAAGCEGVALSDGGPVTADEGVALVRAFLADETPIGCPYCACAGCKSCGGVGYLAPDDVLPIREREALVVGETYDEDYLRRLAAETGAIVIGLDDEGVQP